MNSSVNDELLWWRATEIFLWNCSGRTVAFLCLTSRQLVRNGGHTHTHYLSLSLPPFAMKFNRSSAAPTKTKKICIANKSSLHPHILRPRKWFWFAKLTRDNCWWTTIKWATLERFVSASGVIIFFCRKYITDLHIYCGGKWFRKVGKPERSRTRKKNSLHDGRHSNIYLNYIEPLECICVSKTRGIFSI